MILFSVLFMIMKLPTVSQFNINKPNVDTIISITFKPLFNCLYLTNSIPTH